MSRKECNTYIVSFIKYIRLYYNVVVFVLFNYKEWMVIHE